MWLLTKFLFALFVLGSVQAQRERAERLRCRAIRNDRGIRIPRSSDLMRLSDFDEKVRTAPHDILIFG